MIYRASTHGWANTKFHEICDDIGPTLVIAKSKAGKIFGGYASVSWHSGFGDYKVDADALIFSIDLRQIYRPTKVSCAIFCDSGYGPSFGCQSLIINSNLENGSYCYTKGMFNSYFDIAEEPKSHNNVVTGEGSKQKAAPEKYFTCVEYEVYSVNLLGSSYG